MCFSIFAFQVQTLELFEEMPFHVDRFKNIPEAFFSIAERMPERAVYHQAREGGEPLERTFREVGNRVLTMRKYLQSLGVEYNTREKEQHRVAILSNTRPEWMELDLAILSLGAITVAVYHSLSEDEVAYILYDSGAEIVVAENAEQVGKLLRIAEKSWPIAGTEDREPTQGQIHIKKIIALESVDAHPLVMQLDEILSASESESAKALSPEFTSLNPNDLATLVYTSGTTGPPKGVMQTHRNHLSNIRQVYQAGIVQESSTVFLFLPLAHSFARLMGFIGFLTPVTIYFPAVFSKAHSRLEPRAVLRDMKNMSAHVVPIVPRFLEKMEESIRSRSQRSSIGGRLLRLALSVAERNYADRMALLIPTRSQGLLWRSTAPMRRTIRNSLFGENFQFAVSGGAKLAESSARFFQALEITVLEGYGLTETCVATNFNPIGRNKIGTVGPVLAKDVEQRLEADGEISFRGPNVAIGYWKRPSATANSWDSLGWFHTGDLGSIDEDGYLKIVGRKKEIIVTSGGKKIAPQAIEDEIRAHALVSQAVLVGDGMPFCVALVTLNTKFTPETQAEAEKAIEEHLRKVNERLASFETVKNFLILPEDFTVENGLLTPTFKIKRKLVETTYAEDIKKLFQRTKKPSE